jgi:hypothetical protein
MMQALEAEVGLVVKVEDPDRLRQRLYTIRREDDTFKPLSFVLSPDSPDELWIIKRDAINGKG